MPGVRVRPETVTDAEAIRAVLRGAFTGGPEAVLVDALRRDGDLALSLVAEAGGQVLGCAQFSRMEAPFPALGLGPVAVDAAHRRSGIASGLIRAGLSLARQGGWTAVFCLGEPSFYRRFGFSVAQAAGFASPYAGAHFMVAALGHGLPATTGAVDYAPAFAAM